MTAVIHTINATVAEIEDALKAGRSVQDVARDLTEPPNNVYGVYRDLVARGEITDPTVPKVTHPDLTVAKQQPLPPPIQAGTSLTVHALTTAAERSSSRRTQALGVKFAELAESLRQRLREEREAAEAEQAEREERERAAAEVAELEAKLAAARAKLRPSRRGGASTSARSSSSGESGKLDCSRCGRTCGSAAGRAAHERRCGGAS